MPSRQGVPTFPAHRVGGHGGVATTTVLALATGTEASPPTIALTSGTLILGVTAMVLSKFLEED